MYYPCTSNRAVNRMTLELKANAGAVDASAEARRDMVWVPGGTFRMGSDSHYPEEAPAHRVRVDGFWIDRNPVTNEQFGRFVAETGHRTFAELPPNPVDYPHAIPDLLYPGSLVFRKPSQEVDLRRFANWWDFRLGADWLHPGGPATSLEGLEAHPVVHVAYPDAVLYAAWE